MELIQIATAINGFTDKFGIPRQSADQSLIETRIVFEPAFRVREALRGIEGYSHLWLLWGFSEVPLPESRNLSFGGMSPTVRPPRLGGNTRMGVFATRSPYRPNPIGLSSVRLLRIEDTADCGMVLVVAGADLMNGTPIYDIKPYLSFSDAHPDASNGFAEEVRGHTLQVEVPDDLLRRSDLTAICWDELREILAQDPRPAYQHDPDRVYRMDFKGRTVAFVVVEDTLSVLDVS
ncbi:MAG: tRNA (N6-threonylcarbamoyladenosine(37)-N6)-methyltransferase TrmO [Paludibacteraceae bacterium]